MNSGPLRRVYLVMFLAFLLWSLLMTWYAATWVTVILLPLSALLGWMVGAVLFVPAQRKASMDQLRGKKMEVPDIGRIGLLTGLFSALLMPLILKPMGKEIWDAYNASLPAAGAAAFLALLLDMRRPGYPWPEGQERSRQRPAGRFGLRRKDNPPRGGREG